MKRCAHYLTTKQLWDLRKLSRRTGLTMSELVRRAIDDMLRKAKSRN